MGAGKVVEMLEMVMAGIIEEHHSRLRIIVQEGKKFLDQATAYKMMIETEQHMVCIHPFHQFILSNRKTAITMTTPKGSLQKKIKIKM